MNLKSVVSHEKEFPGTLMNHTFINGIYLKWTQEFSAGTVVVFNSRKIFYKTPTLPNKYHHPKH